MVRINRNIMLWDLNWKFYISLIVATALVIIFKNTISNKQTILAEKQPAFKPILFKRPSELANKDYRDLYKTWKQCIEPLLEPAMNNASEFWDIIHVVGNECGNPVMKELEVQTLKNKDEVKYYLPQKESYDDAAVVSIGVGHDIVTEKKLKQGLENVRIKFFGADPIVEVNKKLYESIGAFFPFAVSGYSGIDVATVLEESGYSDKSVVNLEAIYFFNHYIRRNLIDLLILDAESAEFGILSYFKKDGEFDKNNITFCQINMEIHRPDLEKKEQILEFFTSILNEEKYIVMGFVRISVFLRIYLVNVADQACVAKYLPLTD